MSFTFEGFVEEVRRAAEEGDPNASVRRLLGRTIADADSIIAALPDGDEDEIMFYEDDTLSIWFCRFHPHVLMPPHEHRVVAHIGTFAGAEKNILFRRHEGKLVHEQTIAVAAGDVLSLDEKAIHAVAGEGEESSLALHIYMGPLMKLERSLFDWETGQEIAFTLENFDRLKRPASSVSYR